MEPSTGSIFLVMIKLILLLLMVVPTMATAFCFDEAGKYYNVSPRLLRAIAKVESNFDPDQYNENKNDTGEIVSRDYGLMQINSDWFEKLSEFNVNSRNIYQPCFNVSLGAWVLSANFASHGYNWNSVGAYNAGFKKNARNARNRYIQKVQAVYFSPDFK